MYPSVCGFFNHKYFFLKKTVRIIFRVMAVAVALLILTWVILWGYITYNNDVLTEKVKAGINKQVKGTIEIGKLSTNFFYNFPNIAVKLSNVSIKDSLWSMHRHEFLKAENIYAKLQFFSIFSGKPNVSKITVENAVIYYYTDTTGVSNLIKTNGEPAQKSKSGNVPELEFKNTRVILDYPGRNKYHDILLNQMECKILSNDSGQLVKIKMNAFVHGLGFNTTKGSYLKEKNLSGNFELHLSKAKDIQFDKIKLTIDKQPFFFTGNFSTDQKTFSLALQTKKIDFKKAVSLLTQGTQEKFAAFNILQPVDISAVLDGPTLYKTIPLAVVQFNVKDAAIETPVAQFTGCTFKGIFTNQIDAAKPRTDDNSQLSIKDFTAGWENISLTSKKIEVSNLLQPFLKCDMHSKFDLTALNDLTGSSTMQFEKGDGEMNISYSGSLMDNDTIPTVMQGNLSLKNAAINYVPRNITLNKMQANFVFKNKDLIIETLNAQAGTTVLNMNGSIKNLTELIYPHPEKLVLEWNVSTPNLDLDNFMSFLGKKSSRKIQKKSGGSNKLIRMANKIDSMLEYGTANLNLQAARLNYKKFTATNFSTSLSLLQNQIVLNSARLNNAGGTMLISGSIADAGAANAVTLKTTINNADIPSLFASFNNFGQDAITNQNMKGQLTATVNLNALLSDKGVINPASLKSNINFSVLNGELNNFEPLQKISASVFKKRDFSSIRFAELNDKLQVNGSAIAFDRMEIRSNVFTMFVEGLYDTKKGSDINIEVPLSNLKKIADDEEVIKKGKTGAKIRLRAKTGEDGKLKVSWDPFKNSKKEKEKEKDKQKETEKEKNKKR